MTPLETFDQLKMMFLTDLCIMNSPLFYKIKQAAFELQTPIESEANTINLALHII